MVHATTDTLGHSALYSSAASSATGSARRDANRRLDRDAGRFHCRAGDPFGIEMAAAVSGRRRLRHRHARPSLVSARPAAPRVVRDDVTESGGAPKRARLFRGSPVGAQVLEPGGVVERRSGSGSRRARPAPSRTLGFVAPRPRVAHHHLEHLQPSAPATSGPNAAPKGSSMWVPAGHSRSPTSDGALEHEHDVRAEVAVPAHDHPGVVRA